MKFNKRLFALFLIITLVPTVIASFVAPRHPATAQKKPVATATASQPVALSQNFPDPTALYYQGHYYAYSTKSLEAGEPVDTPVATGSSLTQLHYQGSATTTRPGYTHSTRGPLAPDVFYDGQQFVALATAFDKSQNHYVIGIGSSQKPTGPFRFRAQPLIQDKTGAYNTLDASYYQTPGGQGYIAYATDATDSAAIQLSSVSGSYQLTGSPTTLLRQQAVANPTGNGTSRAVTRVEAPQITRAPDGNYVLFFSANDANKENYFTGYAISPQLTGPYSYQGAVMTTTSLSGKIVGPGGLSLVRGLTSSQARVVFHGWVNFGKPSAIRQAYTARLSWRSGHRPVLSAPQKIKLTQ